MYVRWAFVPNSIAGRPFPLQHPLIQSNHPKLLSIWLQVLYLSEGSMSAALQSWPVAHPPSTSPLSIMYFNVCMYMLFSSMGGDALRASTLGQPPNHDHGVSWFGIQANPIHWSLRSRYEARGTAATCLAVAVACTHHGSNTTTSLSMGQRYIYSACKSNQMALTV